MSSSQLTTRTIQAIATAALRGSISIELVRSGVSTYVYRVRRGPDVFYLRVLPEERATFSPEAAAHILLRGQGIGVPEVVYCEDLNPALQRSVMITTAIEGAHAGHVTDTSTLPNILRSAGRELAGINRVPVKGFGWIRRDEHGNQELRADLPTEGEFMLAGLDDSLANLEGAVVPGDLIRVIQRAAHDHAALLDARHAHLAHGDFDVTHIYCNQGRYTGIIDLGEIRGTGPHYDLGHFRFHDGETLPTMLLPYLMEGYAEFAPFPNDRDRRIAFQSLLIGVRFLARTHARLARHNLLHAIAAIRRDVSLLS